MSFLSGLTSMFGGGSAPAAHANAPAQQAPAQPAPQHHEGGIGGFFDSVVGGASHLASEGLGAVEHMGNNLFNGVNEQRGPTLNPFWNQALFGPDGKPAGDGRPLTTNHIGTQNHMGPIQEGGFISNLMRNTPYLGDYWEAGSVTHDSAHIHPALLNGISAVTDVGIGGALMGLVDAPYRAITGNSLFLDPASLKHDQ